MYNHYLCRRRLPQAFITPDVLTQPEQREKSKRKARVGVMAGANDGPVSSLPPASQPARSPHPAQYGRYLSQRRLCRMSSSPERAGGVSVPSCVGTDRSLPVLPVGTNFSSFRLTSYPLTDCTCCFFSSLLFCRLSDLLPHDTTCQRARHECVQACRKCYMDKICSKSQSIKHNLINASVIGVISCLLSID